MRHLAQNIGYFKALIESQSASKNLALASAENKILITISKLKERSMRNSIVFSLEALSFPLSWVQMGLCCDQFNRNLGLC